MKTDKYTYLIYQQLQGALTPTEEQALAEWLAASPEHQAIREEIVLSMEMLDGFQPDFSVNVEADYAQLKQRMDIPEQQKKAKTIALASRRKWLSIAAALLLLVTASLFLWRPTASTPEWNTLATAAGETQEVTLIDGSKVWVNENSTFSYTTTFSGDIREVKLAGEAFFDIAKKPDQPFKIVTVASTVEVLGTSFNVRAYQEEPTTSVLVKTGKVKFSAQNGTSSKVLLPKDKAVLSHASESIETTVSENFNELFWQNQMLSFRNIPLTEVFKTLEAYFDVKITCENHQLKDCTHSMTPRTIDLEKLFKDLERVYKIKVENKGNGQYIISGGNC